jgi:hypothetical protein
VATAERLNNDFSLRMVNTTEEVSFNIAADPTGSATPNVLSELFWDDMSVWALEANGNIGLGESFKIGLRVGAGAIVDGVASDADYLGDDRTGLFSYATATVDGKHHLYGDFNIGWEFSNSFEVPVFPLGKSGRVVAVSSSISVTPRIGYSYNRHEILFKDGVQVVPDFGPFDGLNSTYKPEWRGVYAGVDGSFKVVKEIYLLVSAKYWPDLRYRGDGGWNLRSDLQNPLSFRHAADGSGFAYEAGLEWKIDGSRALSLSYGEGTFETDPGTDQVYTVDFGEIYTRLNEAQWQTRGFYLQFRWLFAL